MEGRMISKSVVLKMRTIPFLIVGGLASAICYGQSKTTEIVPESELVIPPCESTVEQCEKGSCTGFIVLKLNINKRGRVENPVVTSACPAGVFEEAAVKAVSKWRYNKEMAGREGVTTMLKFTPE
jgi:TonB family protein